jgi:hypothetical protein
MRSLGTALYAVNRNVGVTWVRRGVILMYLRN